MLISYIHEVHTAMPAGQVGIMIEFTMVSSKALQFDEGQELDRIKRICHALAPCCHQQDRSYVHTQPVARRNLCGLAEEAIRNRKASSIA